LAGPDPQRYLVVPTRRTAVQRKEPVVNVRFPAAQLHKLWSRSVAARVDRQSTHSSRPRISERAAGLLWNWTFADAA
jgi:hypothetical protein